MLKARQISYNPGSAVRVDAGQVNKNTESKKYHHWQYICESTIYVKYNHSSGLPYRKANVFYITIVPLSSIDCLQYRNACFVTSDSSQKQ